MLRTDGDGAGWRARLRLCGRCGRAVPDGGGVGTGRLSDGFFCGLACLAAFWREGPTHDN